MKITIECYEKDYALALKAAKDFIDSNPIVNVHGYSLEGEKRITALKTLSGNVKVTVE